MQDRGSFPYKDMQQMQIQCLDNGEEGRREKKKEIKEKKKKKQR